MTVITDEDLTELIRRMIPLPVKAIARSGISSEETTSSMSRKTGWGASCGQPASTPV